MNTAAILFLQTVELANESNCGVVIDGVFTLMLPLLTPSKKVILSNVAAFIRDD